MSRCLDESEESTPPESANDARVLTWPARGAICLIKCYQRYISPLTPPSCRFYPTCSSYTREAIERFGLLRGGALGAWRILRCNPLGKGGVDPVPLKIGAPKTSSEAETAAAEAETPAGADAPPVVPVHGTKNIAALKSGEKAPPRAPR